MRKQVWFLSLYSFALVVPKLLKHGTEIVTWTYAEGTIRYWSGVTPYMAPEKGDVFLYSPMFAVLYGLFAWLPSTPQALAWALLNSVVFWWGVSSWFRLSKKTHWATWVALIAASMELDGSLRYQQVNSLLVGTILLGIAWFRDSKFASSATLLALVTNLKLLPLIFAGPLLHPFRKRYAIPFAIVSVVLILIPGWRHYVDWYVFLSDDVARRQLLDIATIVGKFGAPALGRATWGFVAVVSFALLVLPRFVFDKRFPWPEWICVGLTAALVLSPRTESPTFVLVGPVYLFLAGRREWFARAALLFSIFIVSVVFNSVWPRAWYIPLQEGWYTKTLGTFILWLVSAYALGRETATEVARKSPGIASILRRTPASG